MRYLFFFLILSFQVNAQEDTLLISILEIANDTARVNELYQHGFALRNNSPQQAFRYAKYCEQSALKTQSPKHIAKSYNLLGILFYKKGDFQKALNYHQHALRLRQEANDRLGIALSETNIGNIYVDLKLFIMAEKNHLHAMEIYNQLNDRKRLANCLINLGALKQHMNQQESANEFYKLALNIGNELNDYEIRTICLNNMAIVFYSQKNYQKAIAMNYDALKLREIMENNLEEIDSYLNLASNYLALKEYETAKNFIDSSFSLSTKYEYFEALQEANKLYAEYYAATNKFELAYNWQNKYLRIKDSLLNESNVDYNFNENEYSTSIKSQVQTISNLWLLVGVICCLISVPFILMRYKR